MKKAMVSLMNGAAGRLALLMLLGMSVSFGLLAQVSITGTSTVTQNFDGMGTSYVLPSGFRVSSGGTTSFSSASTSVGRAAGSTGTGVLSGSSSGGLYKLVNGDTSSSSDRAIGFLTSGSFSGPCFLFMQVTNNTTSTINSLTVTFVYEKYRSGTRAFSMAFDTSTGGSTYGGTSFSSGAQSYSADANNTTVSNPPTSIAKSVTITGLSIAAGASYYVRWSYTGSGGSSNAQAIGIDSVGVTAGFVGGCSGTPSRATSSATSTSICSGATGALSITGFSSGTGITYQWQSGASSTGPFSDISGATNTSYTTSALTATTSYRCITTCTSVSTFDTSTVTTITVNPLPTATISGSATISSGASTNLTFGGTANAVVYYWNGASTLNTTLSSGGSSTVSVSPTVTTTYSVTSVTSTAGCSQSITGQFATVTVSGGGSSTDTIPTRDNNLALGNPSSATSSVSDSNNYLMTKSQYTLSYNNRRGRANWVSWHLSRAWKGSAARCDCFNQDGTLPTGYFRASSSDYTGSGFDRGHIVPSDDRDASDTDNTATFLMTNIVPQAPFLNQQPWENMETYCRNLINQGYEMYIVSGSRGTGGVGSSGSTTTTLASGSITVPSNSWKMVVALPVGINDITRITSATRVFAVDIPNQNSVSTQAWESYKISVDSLEALTGYNLMSSVSTTIQNALEARAEVTLAGWDFNAVSSSVTSMVANALHPNMDPATTSSLNTITRGSGASAVSSSGTFATSGFGNDGISTSNTDFFQVKVKAATGYNMSITGIDLSLGGTSSYYASPGVTSQVAYSLDGTTFTLIGNPITSTSLGPLYVDCSGVSALQSLGSSTTVFFRYYASGQTSGGTWGLRSVDTGVYGLAVIGTLDAAPCSGTPSAATATGTPSTICSGGTATLALSGHSTGSSFTYQWQSASGIAGPYTNISGATNTTYTTGAVTATTFYRCITTCTASGLSDSSVADTVIVGAAGVPTIADITGTLSAAAGSTTTLASATSGGTWSSSNTSVATINPSTGVVTGVAAGTAFITYSVTNICGTNFDTAVMTVTLASGTFASIADTAWSGMTATSATGPSAFATLPAATTPGSAAVNVSQWNRSVVVSSSASATYSSSGWSTGSVVDSAIRQRTFAYFIITNNSTTQMRLTRLTIKGVRSGTGPASAQARFRVAGTSTESDFGTAASVPTTAGDINFTGNLCIAPSTSDTIKVYGWGATSSAGTFRVNNGTYINAVYGNVTAALSAGAPTSSSPVCAGTTLSFTGGTASGGLGSYAYSWSGPSAFTSTASSPSIASVTAAAAGVYTYSVTDAMGCSAASTTSVVVDAAGASVSVTPTSSSICTGGSTTFTASGATSYSWAPSAGLSATTGTSVVATPTSTTTYTVTGTTSCGSTTQAFTVNVSGAVTPTVSTSATPSASVCAGTSVTFRATSTGGGSTPAYQWFNNSAAISGATDSTYTYTPTASDTITCRLTSSLACASITTVTSTAIIMTVTPTTTLSIGAITGTFTVAAGATTTLSSTTAGGTWSSSATSTATVSSGGVVTGVASGLAIITYTATIGCATGSDTALITVVPAASVGSIADTAWSGMTAGSATGPSAFATVPAASVPGSSFVSVSQWNRIGLVNSSGSAIYNTSGWTTGSVVDSAIQQRKFVYFIISNNSTTQLRLTQLTIKGQRSATGPATAQARFRVAGSSTESNFGGTASVPTSAGDITFTGSLCIAPSTSDTIKVYAWGASSAAGTVRISNGTYIKATYALVSSGLSTTASSTSSPVCEGSSLSLTGGTVSGGVGSTYSYSWAGPASFSSTAASTSIASVTATAAGTYTFSVTDSFGCSVANSSVVTVNPLPVAGTITGATSVCVAATTTFTTTGTGGVWSSTDTTVASVTSGGVVTGIVAGSATISYTVTNSCGTAVATSAITVNPLASAGVISGASAACTGSSTTLTSSVAGGTWSSSNPSVATIDGSGVVTGVATGTATISYSVTTSCGTDISTLAVTVTAVPTAGTLSGTASACVGSTSTLASTVTGGTWVSSSPTVATIDSISGVVTGISAGTATISYTVTNSCGTAVATYGFTVNPLAVAGTISGSTVGCTGATSSFTTSGTGGTWSSSNTSVATVSSSGAVTGVAAGSATISYAATTVCGTDVATASITIGSTPTAGTLSGASTFCVGVPSSLTSTVGRGTWSSSAPTIATVDTSTGSVMGIAAGSATITYMVTSSCGTATATRAITVIAPPTAGTLSGSTSVCVAATMSLSSTTAGGTWSSSAPSTASINSGGLAYGIAAGSATISYIVSNSCGSDTATRSITVNPLPNAGTISGSSSLCTASSSSLTTTGSGGTWSSSAPSVASVSSTGVVSGISAGSATISYSVTNGCGTDVATSSITVSSPTAGTISGASAVCRGASTTLSSSVAGGTWSSSNSSIAAVDASGNVSGVSVGSVTISYSASSSCGSAAATRSFSVDAAPDPGVITAPTTLCVGATTTVTTTGRGGVWSSTATASATVNASTGVVTGVSAGGTFISYTVTNGCGTMGTAAIIAVYALPSAGVISGPSTLFVGTTPTFTNTVGGGTWRSSNTSVATVSSGGVVTARATGVATISYSVSGLCGTAVATRSITVAVPDRPVFLLGNSTNMDVCSNFYQRYSLVSRLGVRDTSVGRSLTWSLVTSPTRGIATVSYTALSNGSNLLPPTTASMSYAPDTNYSGTDSFQVQVSNGTLSSIMTVYVRVRPVLVSTPTVTGTTEVCLGGTTTLTGSPSGGTFFRTGSGFNITSAGVVTATAVASSTAIYSLPGSNGCSAYGYALIRVVSNPAATISGATSVCPGASTTLTASRTGGAWSTTTLGRATVSSTGVVTGVSAGVDTVMYATTNACGTTVARRAMTVTALPNAGTISGPTSVVVGSTITLTTSGATGGTWSSSNNAIASVSSARLVRGRSAGTATISYRVTNACGAATATYAITVTASKESNNGVAIETGGTIVAYPNPTTGVVTIELPQLVGKADMIVVDAAGTVVHRLTSELNKTDIDMSYYASGIYFVTVVSGEETYRVRVVKQ